MTSMPAGRPWWRDAVVYQLYVRSFSDSDGDGVGDLGGVAAHLDYLAALGVDAIWLNPCYPSPNNDGGYDISDYTGIDARYGGLPAFEKVLSTAHEHGLRVLMDLVPNHCSYQHPWFQAALAAPPGSRERARFHFRNGRGTDGEDPPNNWLSTFGGPAWTRITGPDGRPGQWYLHSFDATQPDFNWDNPEVGDLFADVIRTWLDRGVDGFRIDVAYAMVKHPGLPDAPDPQRNPYSWNQPGVHAVFERWRTIAAEYPRDVPLIGEVWLPPAATADYIRPGRLDAVFYFDLMQQPWELAALRKSITTTVAHLPAGGGVPAWTLNNHDVHRAVSRYGLVRPAPMHTNDANALRTRARGEVDTALGTARARAAALLLLGMPGSVYLYQGEELGLPEVQDLPPDARQDPIWTRSAGLEHGRDGSRIPLPWTSDGTNFGFSPRGAAPPWLPQPAWFADYAIGRQLADPASTVNLYRAALARRAETFGAGDPTELEWLSTGRYDVLAYRRGHGVCATVFGAEPFTPPTLWGQPVLRSGPDDMPTLATDESAWYRLPE